MLGGMRFKGYKSVVRAAIIIPRPVGGAGALSGDRRPSSVRPSVRLSDVAYIGSNSKTKRPRKTKRCTGYMRLPYRLQGQKVKSQGHGAGHIVAAT